MLLNFRKGKGIYMSERRKEHGFLDEKEWSDLFVKTGSFKNETEYRELARSHFQTLIDKYEKSLEVKKRSLLSFRSMCSLTTHFGIIYQ